MSAPYSLIHPRFALSTIRAISRLMRKPKPAAA